MSVMPGQLIMDNVQELGTWGLTRIGKEWKTRSTSKSMQEEGEEKH
jgi:hypothetical protein